MAETIKKELLESILQLHPSSQEEALRYVRELLDNQEMKERAKASEKAIEEGRVKSIDDFKRDFEAWKAKKRGTMK